MATVQRLPSAARAQQLIGAAASVFAQRGFAGTSMDDVARVAGVTRLIVYRRFGSKEQLYRAVLEQVAGALQSALGDLPPRAGRARREYVAGAVLTVARTMPDAFRLLWGQAIREPEFADHATRVRALIVQRTIALFGPDEGTPVRRAWVAATMVDFLFDAVLRWLDLGDSADDAWLVTTVARAMEAQARAVRQG
jgi:AcrR family transcriptional regulator